MNWCGRDLDAPDLPPVATLRAKSSDADDDFDLKPYANGVRFLIRRTSGFTSESTEISLTLPLCIIGTQIHGRRFRRCLVGKVRSLANTVSPLFAPRLHAGSSLCGYKYLFAGGAPH